MKILSINRGEYVPSNKSLYFTKTPTVVLNDTLNLFAHEEVSTTRKGIKYLKDTQIPNKIKKRFAENEM